MKTKKKSQTIILYRVYFSSFIRTEYRNLDRLAIDKFWLAAFSEFVSGLLLTYLLVLN